MEDNKDNRIEEALLLQEKGKKDTEILELFSDVRDELSSIFEMQKLLTKEGEGILPSKALLAAILQKIPNNSARRPSPFFTMHAFMYAAPAALLAVVILLIGVQPNKKPDSSIAMDQANTFQHETMSLKQATPSSGTRSAALPEATGDVDSAMASLYQDSDREEQTVNSELEESSLVSQDSGFLSDINSVDQSAY